jgi:hypothetical protein
MVEKNASAWVAAFAKAMRNLGRRRGGHDVHFFAEACEEHEGCIIIKLYRLERHVKWKDNSPVETARVLAKHT